MQLIINNCLDLCLSPGSTDIIATEIVYECTYLTEGEGGYTDCPGNTLKEDNPRGLPAKLLR